MTRKELILSDEYLSANSELIIVGKKNVTFARVEMTEFLKSYRDELLELNGTSLAEVHRNTRHDAIEVVNKQYDFYQSDPTDSIREMVNRITRDIQNLKQR